MVQYVYKKIIERLKIYEGCLKSIPGQMLLQYYD